MEQQSIFDVTIFIHDDVQLGHSLRCVVSPSNVQEGRRECHRFCESSEICDSTTGWSCRSAVVCSILKLCREWKLRQVNSKIYLFHEWQGRPAEEDEAEEGMEGKAARGIQ